MRVAAIDQGTTSTRVHVFEEGERPRNVHSIRHAQSYPRAGWVEHDPLELLSNVRACLEAAGRVDAIGLANQGESCMAWDAETGEPLSPVIVWQDSRTDDSIERLKAEGAESEVMARAGLPLDCYFSATKLSWIVHHSTEAQAAHRAGRLRLGTTDTFLLDRLTGVFATDATTASRTSLMNIGTTEWDDSLCRMFGVPREALAPIRPTTSHFGDISGTPVTASAVDQQAALYGHGCRTLGDAKVTFGTGAFALAITGTAPPLEAPGGLTATVAWMLADATTYALEGGVYDVGSIIEWVARIGLIETPSDLSQFEGPSALSRGLVFVPALSGLACPQWDRSAAGLWVGMTTATTRKDLQRSLLEGVAMQTSAVLRTMESACGLSDCISVDGGVTASAYFLQFLANATQKTIVKKANAELTAYGMALLAGLPAETVPDMPDARYDPDGCLDVHETIYAAALERSAGWHALHRR